MPLEIVYADADGENLAGDLYLPAGAGPHPVIVAVHGGGFQFGDKAGYGNWGPFLAARGYALFSINYRLAKPGRKSFPMAAQDVKAAVQFIKHNAAQWQLDPARVALMGDSAGGHLAALAALAGDHPILAGAHAGQPYAQVSPKVKAAIGIYGAYDLLAQWQHDLVCRPHDHAAEHFLGARPTEDRKLYFDASPISYATVDRNSTPFFLVWGTEDDVVDCKTQSEAFLLALKQARFFVRTAVVHGAPHFWMWDALDETGSHTGWLAPRLLRFLGANL